MINNLLTEINIPSLFFRNASPNMNFLYALLLLCSIHTVLCDDASPFGISPRQDLNFIELAAYDGYLAEQHSVTTEDGYILTIFRLPVNESCTAIKDIIIFTHGLYLSGDDCLIPGPGKALCYIFVDNCYEVWVPNVRGSYYSRNHTKYNPDTDKEYWNFSVDEMGIHDLPAVIDYVLLKTNETQITYVAHSQGASMLLILCAKKPEYNAKIKVGFGLSPTAWLEHARFIVIKFQSLLAPLFQMTGEVLHQEILERNGVLQNSGELLCGSTNLAYPLCSVFIFAALGYNEFQITSEVLPVVVGHTPSGTSLKNFIRWGQMQNNGFTEFDYGALKNFFTYGQLSPPEIDLSGVTMKWVFLGSNNDYVANVTDIKTLQSRLTNSELCVLSDQTFGHLDFIYGKDIRNYITPVVLSYLETGSYICP